MPINLSGRSFLKLLDFKSTDLRYLLDLSKNFKNLKQTGTPHKYLEGKTPKKVIVVPNKIVNFVI